MHQGRRRQPNMGVMLLLYQIFGVIGYENIPPITLGAIGLQTAIFLRLFKLPWYKASQVCVSAYRVWYQKEFSRLLYGALEHGDDWHLYYNMVSFAIKGRSLERRYGSVKFAYILIVFTFLTNAVLVALLIFANKHFGESLDQCAVGFSGVIFALKVLTTHYDSSYTNQIMGIPLIVPSKYAVWIELVLIQLFVPNASFYGHLAGILVGMAYVKGPLKGIMDMLYSMAKAIIFPTYRPGQFTPRAGPSGYRNDRQQPRENEYRNFVPPNMSEEEQVRRAMEESLRDSSPSGDGSYTSSSPGYAAPPPPGFVSEGNQPYPPPPAGFMPDIDEIRHRREARFANNCR